MSSLAFPALPTRRFGRTELAMPVLSLGGMRFQQSWSDLEANGITQESQRTVEVTLRRAVELGFHHLETARHYGSSERQLGWALPLAPDPDRILQTKVPPREDPAVFEAELWSIWFESKSYPSSRSYGRGRALPYQFLCDLQRVYAFTIESDDRLLFTKG